MEENDRMRILAGTELSGTDQETTISEAKDKKEKELQAIEIIDKHDYLQKAFKYILLNNKSNDNPYHDLNHLLTVMKYCYQGAKKENVTGKALKELLITAIFHDVNHSGGKKSDEENIKMSKKAIKEFVESEDIDVSLESMDEIIEATQYPYVIEADDLNVMQSIIRDADLMQVYEYNWIQQNIGGLSSELNMDFIDFLKPQRKFLESAEFNTDWGKELKKERWTDVMKQFKMLEDACSVKLKSNK